jgi:hypothetical protein
MDCCVAWWGRACRDPHPLGRQAWRECVRTELCSRGARYSLECLLLARGLRHAVDVAVAAVAAGDDAHLRSGVPRRAREPVASAAGVTSGVAPAKPHATRQQLPRNPRMATTRTALPHCPAVQRCAALQAISASGGVPLLPAGHSRTSSLSRVHASSSLLTTLSNTCAQREYSFFCS